MLDYQFTTHDLLCLGLCSTVGVWYILKKHWLANDLLGMAFAINGVELLHLNNVVTGCILLGGLFFYDIFWVFGTDVMVTVAKSFEAPIKLVFPQDLLENGLNASNFAMLGLGDIVIPGIFIALLLRYDVSLKRNSNFYFYATFIGESESEKSRHNTIHISLPCRTSPDDLRDARLQARPARPALPGARLSR